MSPRTNGQESHRSRTIRLSPEQLWCRHRNPTGVGTSSKCDHPPSGRTPRVGGIHASSDRREPTACGRPPTREVSGEFRRDVAALVIDQNRTIADVAKELDLVEQTVGNWVRQERIDRGERDGTTTEMREENARLRREVKRLQMERDLLKRSVAFWVKELDR